MFPSISVPYLYSFASSVEMNPSGVHLCVGLGRGPQVANESSQLLNALVSNKRSPELLIQEPFNHGHFLKLGPLPSCMVSISFHRWLNSFLTPM